MIMVLRDYMALGFEMELMRPECGDRLRTKHIVIDCQSLPSLHHIRVENVFEVITLIILFQMSTFGITGIC